MIKEIRVHGRGGQGAVTFAEIIALASINEGKHAQAFPSFGPERRGAPVAAFIRISDEKIRIRYPVNEPDILVVLDPRLISVGGVCEGLKKDGIAVVNTTKNADEIRNETQIKGKITTVDAAGIAKEILGLPIVNTTMLGAVAKVTGIVKLKSLENPLRHKFGKVAEKNIAAMKVAYERVEVKK